MSKCTPILRFDEDTTDRFKLQTMQSLIPRNAVFKLDNDYLLGYLNSVLKERRMSYDPRCDIIAVNATTLSRMFDEDQILDCTTCTSNNPIIYTGADSSLSCHSCTGSMSSSEDLL